MNLKSLLAKPFANYIYNKTQKSALTALEDQDEILKNLLKVGRLTEFGKAHHFKAINSHQEYIQAVPIRDYEQIKPYIELIKEGKQNVLWKGKPIYLAKTSGTTSGVKYIPRIRAGCGYSYRSSKWYCKSSYPKLPSIQSAS